MLGVWQGSECASLVWPNLLVNSFILKLKKNVSTPRKPESSHFKPFSRPAITCSKLAIETLGSKLTIETLGHSVKYVQS